MTCKAIANIATPKFSRRTAGQDCLEQTICIQFFQHSLQGTVRSGRYLSNYVLWTLAPLDVSRETKLEGFFGARFSKPFICECLVQLSKRPDLTWPMWQHCDIWPRFPFKEGLVPHLLGVLSTGSLQLTALFGNCPSFREPVHLKSFLFMGLPISNDLSVQGYKVARLPISGQLWRSFQLQSSHGGGQGCYWICIRFSFSLLPSFLQLLVWRALLNKHPTN